MLKFVKEQNKQDICYVEKCLAIEFEVIENCLSGEARMKITIYLTGANTVHLENNYEKKDILMRKYEKLQKQYENALLQSDFNRVVELEY